MILSFGYLQEVRVQLRRGAHAQVAEVGDAFLCTCGVYRQLQQRGRTLCRSYFRPFMSKWWAPIGRWAPVKVIAAGTVGLYIVLGCQSAAW